MALAKMVKLATGRSAQAVKALADAQAEARRLTSAAAAASARRESAAAAVQAANTQAQQKAAQVSVAHTCRSMTCSCYEQNGIEGAAWCWSGTTIAA